MDASSGDEEVDDDFMVDVISSQSSDEQNSFVLRPATDKQSQNGDFVLMNKFLEKEVRTRSTSFVRSEELWADRQKS